MDGKTRARVLWCVFGLILLNAAENAAAQETWDDAMKAYRTYQMLDEQGKYRQALPYAKRVVDLALKIKGENDPNYLTSLNNLACLYHDMGDHGKALPLYTQALEIRRNLLGKEHLDVAESLNNLATLHDDMGEGGKALPLYTQALEIKKKALGEEHPGVARG